MADESKYLNRDDLFLLMESYRNMVQMHSTLVEQHKQIIDFQNSLSSKQDLLSSDVTKIYEQIDSLSNSFEVCTEKVEKISDSLSKAYNLFDKSLSNSDLENTKQHSGINTRIYVAMGGSITVIISLITLFMTISAKYDGLNEMVKAIMKHLNIVP